MRIRKKSIKHQFKGLWNYIKQYSFFENIYSWTENKTIIKILILWFIGHLLRIETTNDIFESDDMKRVSKKMFGRTFDVDTARYHLDNLSKSISKTDISQIMINFVHDLSKKRILQKIATYTCENGLKLIPIAVDGTEFFRTYNNEKIKKLGKDANTGYTDCKKKNTKKQFAKHSALCLSTVVGSVKLFLGLEIAGKQESNMDKNDCEKNLFLKIIKNLRKGTKISNILIIGDAIYTDMNRMKECIENNLNFLFTLKDNAGKDLQQELRDKIIGYNIPYKTAYIQVGRMLHHIKYRRVISPNFIEGTLIYIYEFYDIDTGEIEMVVSNIDLPLRDAYFLKHKRWNIENMFNDTTKHCNITHNFVLTAKNITTLFQLIGNNFVQLYFKYYIKSLKIVNGQEEVDATVKAIRSTLFKMRNYQLLSLEFS